jgi:hypothetical protein
MDRPTQAPAASTSAAITLDFGDGSDGAAVLNGTDAVTGFTRSGSVYTATTAQEFQWTDCTISSGVVVNPAGCPLLVSGTLTMLGTASIDSGGGDASQNTAGAVSSGLTSARFYYGAAAGAGRTTPGAGAASAALQASAQSMGGNGGAGGLSGSVGGTGTALTQWSAAKGSLRSIHLWWRMQDLPILLAALQGGGGGGGGGVSTLTGATGYSGGGGSGGGVVVVRARNLVGSGTTAIRANGGAGASAAMTGTTGGGGGGGAGGGGFVSCAFDSITGAVVFSANAGASGNASSVGAQAANGGAGANGGRVWVACRTKSTAITLSATGSNGGAAGAGGGSAGANGSAGLTVEADL